MAGEANEGALSAGAAGQRRLPAALSKALWSVAALAIALDAVHAATGSRLGVEQGVWVTWLPVTTLGLLAAAALASVTVRSGARSVRLFIGLGMACYAPGTAIYTHIVAHQASQAFPSYADYCWIAFYPCVLIALGLCVRRYALGVRPVVLLDAALGGLAVMAAGSLLLVKLAIGGVGMHAAGFGTIFYSLADQLLVGVAVGTFALYGWRPPRALVLLTFGLALQSVEDAIYMHDMLRGTFPTDGWLIVYWLLNFGLMSAAAVFARTVRRERVDYESSGAAAAFGFAILVVPVTIAIMFDPSPWAVAIVLDSLALVAVVGRMAITLRTNLALLHHARKESLTDPLTGLGNRRSWFTSAEQAIAEAAKTGGKVTVALFDLDGFKSYNDAYGHPAGDALLRRLGTRMQAAVPSPAQAFRLGGDEFCVLIPGSVGVTSEVVARVGDALTESGEAFFVGNSYGTAILPDDAPSAAEALAQADIRMYAMKRQRPLRTQASAFALLRQVSQEIDPDTQAHQTEVADLAARVAESFDLEPERITVLKHAAEFHDIGKIAIPDSILRKPAPLDEDEWVYVRRHTVIGERILRAVPGMEEVASVVRASHERIDGAGYPDGLSGEEIPLAARIILVCDAFHAITADRPYRRGRPVDEALAELERCAGTQFDPAVVRALKSVVCAPEPALACAA
jgi:two-component system cell cycle response regulator